jgi:ferredoxin-NADP reductase
VTTSSGVQWHLGRVISRRFENPSAVRLELDVPTWPGNDAGAHVDVRLTAPDGYQASRSYSLASSGESTRVVLMVQELPTGEVSPFLVRHLAEGEDVEVQGPLGRFFVWSRSDTDRSPIQLIAGGSGVVPLFAIASAREREADGRLTRNTIAERTFAASRSPRVFVCGPSPFVEAVTGWLVDLGHDAARIRTERFGGSS